MKRIMVLTDLENLALSVIRTLGGRGLSVGVAGSGCGALLRLSRHCASYTRIASDGREFAEAGGPVLEAAERAIRNFDPGMIVPVDVAGAFLAAKLKERFPGRLFFPSPDAETLRRMDNKWSFYEFLLDHGLPSPKTRLIEDAAGAASLTIPVVIKPPADSGGRGVAVVRTAAELAARLEGATYPLLAQEYVEGEDVDLSFLADRGRMLAWAVQMRSREGTIHFIDDARVVEIGRRLAAASVYTGLAHIDMRYDGPARGRVLVIESNPRFWETFSFTLGMGADFIGLGMDLALGNNPAPMTKSPVGSSLGLTAALGKVLRGRGISSDSFAHILQKVTDPGPEALKAFRRCLGYGQIRSAAPAPAAMNLEINLEAGRLACALAWAAAALSAAFVATRVMVFGFGFPRERRLAALFDLGREGNLPALFGGGLLLTAAALLAVAAQGERGRGRPARAWQGLSFLFVFLAFDKWLSFHEALIKPVSAALKTDGLLRFAWVVPYGILTAVVGVACLSLLRRLPARTRNLFVVAGAVYVAGALGCELIGGLIAQRLGRDGPAFALEVLVEESLEMGGAILFIYAIAAYIRDELAGLSVRVGFNAPTRSAT